MAKYEIIDFAGKKARQYPDGSIRDGNGRFLQQHPLTQEITTENAHALARTRWQKFREVAADAVAAEIGSSNPGATTPMMAWGVLVARTAQAIMDSDKPRGDDMERVGRAMGALPIAGLDNDEGGDNGSGDAAAIHAVAGLVAQVRGLLDDVLIVQARGSGAGLPEKVRSHAGRRGEAGKKDNGDGE